MPNTAPDVTVPTVLERKGDFSQSVRFANHRAVKLYDPTNGQLFPGSVIPANRIWAPGAALGFLPQKVAVRQILLFHTERTPTWLRSEVIGIRSE